VRTSGGVDATSLYNVPNELIDPRDPVISKLNRLFKRNTKKKKIS